MFIKRALALTLIIFTGASVSFAAETYVIDTPSSQVLSYGAYDINFSFFSQGDLVSRVEFGILKFLNLGVSWELDQFVGDKQVSVATPALQVKFKIYNGGMMLPALAVGYNGQGCFLGSEEENDKYLQKAKGVYIVASREFLITDLMFNIGINTNDFPELKTYGFIGVTLPLYKEIAYFMVEYDNIRYLPRARLNMGIKFYLTEYIDADFIIRDCLGKEDSDVWRISNERIFKISYSGKF